MDKQLKEAIRILAVLAICIGALNLTNAILSSYLFIHSVQLGKTKAIVDATNYKEMYSKIIINAIPFLIIWISLILSGLMILKFKKYGRNLIIATSILGLLIFFMIPFLQFLMNFKNAIISFDSIIGFFVVNVWFFYKKDVKEVFLCNSGN